MASTIKVLDPRVDVVEDGPINHIVLQGGRLVNQQIVVSDSWGAPNTDIVSDISFTINPPSTTTIIDRMIKVRYFVAVLITTVGNNPTDIDEALVQPGDNNNALRQMPMSSIIDTTTVQINGESFSDTTGDIVKPMLHYGLTTEAQSRYCSTTPMCPDAYQEYYDWQNYGSAKNPLQEYGNMSDKDPRGGFTFSKSAEYVGVVPSKVVKYYYEITEPLFLSPFSSGFQVNNDVQGFVNVNQMNLNLRFKSGGLISGIWSNNPYNNDGTTPLNADAVITNIAVQFYQAPEVLLTYISPDVNQLIPPLQILPYKKPLLFKKDIGSFASFEQKVETTDSIKLSQIPRKMYLWCSIKPSSTTPWLKSDAYLTLRNLSILWSNQTGLMSSATPQQLYEISVRNGLEKTYTQFKNFTGSVFCCEFGTDIGLLDDLAPGTQSQQLIQIQATWKNTSTKTHDYIFNYMFLLEGTISITENSARCLLGSLTPADVINAKRQPDKMTISYAEYNGGGNFFQNLKSFVRKLGGFGNKVLSGPIGVGLRAAFPEFSPIIEGVHSAAKMAQGAGRRRLR
jgi:hypothetical protein